MAKVKAWKFADSSQPDFPDDFEIAQKAVLQVTDIKSNHNKYYAVELHQADENGSTLYRVFTHYGRTDDLDRNPESGQKECRYYDSLGEAQAGYHSIYNQKTAPRKGYKEVSLAASNIGSQKARGTSSGEVDEKTLAKIEEAEKEKAGKKKKEPPKTLDLHAKIRSLVEYVFAEATNALTTTVNAKITANGIETPLGILTIGQIEKGEDILDEAYALFNKKRARNRADRLEQLTGEFYTLIPHRIGRTRAAIADSVIDSLEKFGEKQETLQLMKDMLQVAGEGEENVLFNQQIDQQYLSLKCHLDYVEKKSDEFKEIEAYVINSQVQSKSIKVREVYKVKRPAEEEKFTSHIGNQQMLFHGSRIQNWVGLLSRGILMPKVVVKMGVNRTDAGWLGNGIYFGNAACTSEFYTTAGGRSTRLLAINSVALGKVKKYKKITYGITEPPKGFDSCHGIRHTLLNRSEFADDEIVIYNDAQQKMEYLVEFKS